MGIAWQKTRGPEYFAPFSVRPQGSTTTDRGQRRLAEKGDPKYISTIPRAILPKPSLGDEITDETTATKSSLCGQFVSSQLTWLGPEGALPPRPLQNRCQWLPAAEGSTPMP